MNLPRILPAAILLCLPLFASARSADPCHTKSRQMTMAKNCFTGDMAKPGEAGPHFFGASPPNEKGASYCYNSLVSVEHKSGGTLLHVHVLRDNKEGKFHAYDFALSPEEIKRMKKDAPLIELSGLKGDCFSPTGDKEACNGGILKTLGFVDTSLPMVIALNRTTSGQYTVARVSDAKEMNLNKPKAYDGLVFEDNGSLTDKLIQEIRKKISTAAHAKMASIQTGATSPKKMADSSEQFRYCTMAFDGLLKSQKLNDPFSPEEKMTLATLTNYMNNDSGMSANTRMPASTQKPRPVKK